MSLPAGALAEALPIRGRELVTQHRHVAPEGPLLLVIGVTIPAMEVQPCLPQEPAQERHLWPRGQLGWTIGSWAGL